MLKSRAFYAGCLDERITAVIASDFGIAFDSTNWDAPWYLGPLSGTTYTNRGSGMELELGHHHLLSLMAPRSFLLIGGEFDEDRAWQYLEEARPAWALHGAEAALGFHNHATGHRPPESANNIAYAWLQEQWRSTESKL